jgi:hypothetical protein
MPGACTGTSGWNDAACWCPGRSPEACRRIRRQTGWRSGPRDYPLGYASFEGEIPPGQYGAGTVRIWDRGTYETEKWTDEEIKVVLHGSRVSGRYVLIHTGQPVAPAPDGPGRPGPLVSRPP